MAISAQEVKQLREMTGAGMMDCKKALQESGGDMDAALAFLQKKGAAAAAKKAGRIAAEGMISSWISDDAQAGVIIEINCETDFVSRNEQFQEYVDVVTKTAAASGASTLEGLNEAEVPGIGKPLGVYTSEQIATIGEKIDVRRIHRFDASNGLVSEYLHAGNQIGVLIQLALEEGADRAKADEFARDVAMHVAAMKPPYLSEDDIDPAAAASYKEILVARAKESGKPDNIIERMVEGQMAKWRAESTLLNQPFVKDSDVTVGELQGKVGAGRIVKYVRFEVGEGIEKQSKSLSEEVAEQLRGA